MDEAIPEIGSKVRLVCSECRQPRELSATPCPICGNAYSFELIRDEESVTEPGQWQAETIRRLESLGYNGFTFGPGVNWWPIDQDKNKAAGPFTSTQAFDAWLTDQEHERDK